MRKGPCLLTLALACALAGCARPPRPIPTAAQPCPQWLAWPADFDYSNAEPLSPACVEDSNLRAMLDDPADAISGKPLGPADGERAADGVDAYEQGKTKPFLTGSETGTATTGSAPGGSP